jgi:hypothetical protein
MVYGSVRDEEKAVFLQQTHELNQPHAGPWLLINDFNLIYHAKDKNNGRLNRHQMGQLHQFLNIMALKELHLRGRLFTWSNERLHPTLKHIDRAFYSIEWEEL